MDTANNNNKKLFLDNWYLVYVFDDQVGITVSKDWKETKSILKPVCCSVYKFMYCVYLPSIK